MNYTNNQNCNSNNYCGCGQQYPIVPGSNPSLQTWNGQRFVVADGSIQLPIYLPNLEQFDPTQVSNVIGMSSTGQLVRFADVQYSPDNALVTATGSTTPRTLANRFADVINVKDFGAVGDGVTDDTAAIQAALSFVSVTEWAGSSVAMHLKSGGTIYFPDGVYRVTKTLKIGQGTTLLGTANHSNFLGFPPTSSSYKCSVILADFQNINAWVLDSAVYNTSTGQPLAYSESVTGAQFDAGTYNYCEGISVKNLFVYCNQTIYGSIRLAGSSFCNVENVYVYNSDFGILFMTCYGCSIRNVLIRTNLNGFAGSLDINGITIDNVWTEPGPNSSSRSFSSIVVPAWWPVSYDMGTGIGFPQDISTKKIGIMLYYSNSTAVTNTITQNWDIGRYYCHCPYVTDNSSYHESITTYLIAAASTSGLFNAVEGIVNPLATTFYAFAQSANITLNAAQVGKIYVNNSTYTSIRILESKPDIFGWGYNDLINYVGSQTGVIQVSASGSIDNIAYNTTYTTLDEALRRISISAIPNWTIIVKSGDTVTSNVIHNIIDKNITFVNGTIGGTAPNIQFFVSSGNIVYWALTGNVSLRFDNVNINFTPSSTATNAGYVGALYLQQYETVNLTLEVANSTIGLQSSFALIQQGYHTASNINSTFQTSTITGSASACIMAGAYSNAAYTNVISGQYGTATSSSVKAIGTNGWTNSNVVTSNF